MIEQVRMRNFKCFREETVPFGGLTVLAGANGAGKSSAIEAVLALRQCWMGGRGAPWDGPLVDLGTFSEVLHAGADADAAVGIEASFGGGGRACFEQRASRNGGVRNGGAGGRAGMRKCDPDAEKHLRGHVFYLSADRLGPGSEHVLRYLDRRKDAAVAAAARHPGGAANTLSAQTDAWLESVSRGAGCALAPVVALLAPKADLPDCAGHLVIIEHPEAHLHPSGQTSLAELAARAAAGGSQVVLETHGDHVFDGVRLAVLDGILRPEQIVVNYFEREGLVARITTPVLSGNGRLDIWPEGFFDQHERNLSRLVGLSPPATGRPTTR